MHEDKPSRTELVIAALIAVSLLMVLVRFPRPGATAGTPWLVELATTLALGCAIALLAVGEKEFLARLFTIRDPLAMWIARLFAVFILWSLVSAAWAREPYVTVHHTLLWGEYLLFFLFTYQWLSAGNGTRLLAMTSAITVGIIGVLCLIEYITLPDFAALEPVIRGRYGAYSELLGTMLPIVWIAGIYARKLSGYLLSLAIGSVGWAAAMLSLSKGAFLAGILGALVMFAGVLISSGKRFRRRTLQTGASWIILTVGVQAGFSLLSPVPATIDCISGRAGAIRTSNMQRIFIWKIGVQMAADHPFIGVGADNFGIAFNDARAAYRTTHPDDPPDEPVSDNLAARAHNEPLQIAAELGVIGSILAVAPFLLVAYLCLRRIKLDGRPVSPMLWAAIGGLAAFAASSMVSSFSLRIAQNGVAFVMVMALAVYYAGKDRKPRPTPAAGLTNAILYPAVASFFLLSIALSGTKAVAEYLLYVGDRTRDKQAALDLYARALELDPTYAGASLHSWTRNYEAGEFTAAASDLRRAIDDGSGVVFIYSALADSHEKAGQPVEAESSFHEAFRIFPRSVFLRVRYAIFLERAGRKFESDQQMVIARSIDHRQADGWHNLLTIGSTRAFYAARENPELALPAELLPEAAVLQYLDKPLVEDPR